MCKSVVFTSYSHPVFPSIHRGSGGRAHACFHLAWSQTRGNNQTLEPWLARLTDSCRHAPQSSCVTWSGSLYGCVLEETSWSSPPPTVVKSRRSLQRWCSRVWWIGSNCPHVKSRPEVGWDPTILVGIRDGGLHEIGQQTSDGIG